MSSKPAADKEAAQPGTTELPPEGELKLRPAVYAALGRVMKYISKVGIEKSSERTEGQKYFYRGIDDVTWVVSGVFAENDLIVVPRYSKAVFVKRATRSGSWYIAKVEGSFDFVSMKDGSKLTIGPFPGEAGDSGDKAMSKACSVCLRNALLQTFLAPVGPEADPESAYGAGGTDEPAPEKEKPAPRSRSEQQEKPARKVEGEVSDPLGAGPTKVLEASLKRKGLTRAQFEEEHGLVDSGNLNDMLAIIKAL